MHLFETDPPTAEAPALVRRTVRVRGVGLAGPVVLSVPVADFADLVARARAVLCELEAADMVELLVNGLAIAQVFPLA